ncbi:Mlr3248 protein [Olavius sp. associated proteobacterium Delta 1]|nr:Mlr3248 protein [Olavius sp. associated proteobacterium Delta 1]
MNIIIYCQYVWGMGHLVRSLEFARALSDHKVALVAGGQDLELDLPGHVNLVRLPALYMDEMFTTLLPGDSRKTVAQIKQQRQEMLYALFEQKQPDVFIIELYPFGRSIFGFELEPLLADVRSGKFGAVKTVCSLRDILVEKKDPAAYEERVLQKLNRDFDALLIHADENLLRLNETFSRVDDIDIPVAYTGFITQQADPASGGRLRRDLNISSEQKLIVASAGGGRSGYKLLTFVLDACEKLRDSLNYRLEIFSGPFMENKEFDKLAARSAPGTRIQRYTRRFLDYLYAADLSISLAGYNTCMNLLVTRVPALVYPYARQREQPMRVDKIKNLLPMKILNEDDVRPDRLSDYITQMLDQKRSLKTLPIDMNGAANAARILGRWVNKSLDLTQ